MKATEKRKQFAKYKGSWIINSLLCVLVGLALTIWPGVIVDAANYILGGIILVVGIIYLAISFWGKFGSFLKGFGIFLLIVTINEIYSIIKLYKKNKKTDNKIKRKIKR